VFAAVAAVAAPEEPAARPVRVASRELPGDDAAAPTAAGAGVAATTGSAGGATVAVPPTAPLSTATRTASPTTTIEHASSHARRSEGGEGRCAAGVGSGVGKGYTLASPGAPHAGCAPASGALTPRARA